MARLLESRAMAWSRRTFCAVGITALAVLPVGSVKTRAGAPGLRALSSELTDRAAARRLGHLCASSLGAAEAAALVREQELRLLREAPNRSRSSIAALIGADFRAGRTIDVRGARLSRLEGAILLAGSIDLFGTADFT
jgi:hypothetical protein